MQLPKRLAFEFWPNWLLYLPVFVSLPYWLLRYRQLGIISLANPGFYFGGIKNENKLAILRKLPVSYIPKTVAIQSATPLHEAMHKMHEAQINFPCIIKPQYGERGTGVEKLSNAKELQAYLNAAQEQLMLQAFIDYPEELGVLCYQTSEGHWKISSMVRKEFLQVVGNGKDTLQTLISKHLRAQTRVDYLFNKFANQLKVVLPEGEVFLLEPIGNHCRGTSFRDAQFLITPALTLVFENLCKQIEGFYIGRFDIKVPSLQALQNGEKIVVLELNGITSEPAHIYEPGRGFVKGWKDLWLHWHRVFELGEANRKKGLKVPRVFNLFEQLKNKEPYHE